MIIMLGSAPQALFSGTLLLVPNIPLQTQFYLDMTQFTHEISYVAPNPAAIVHCNT